MKPHDEDEETASPEEMREAAALAAALESNAAPLDAGSGSSADVSDAMEAAALLRHARAPLNVPAAHEAIVTAHVAPALDARRAQKRRRSRMWIAASIAAPAAAAAWLLFGTASIQRMALRPSPPPAPSADLLAAQAQATRGGSQTTGALAALDLKMRAYRRQYHEDLRHRGGGEP